MSSVPQKRLAIGPNGETAEFLLVSPKRASDWLAHNIDTNRNIKKSRVAGYMRDIAAGEWHVTGEAIKFDTDGRLIDGQNRLTAISQGTESVWLLVVRNILPDSFKSLDSGTARSASDVLTVTGTTQKADAKDVAAIARAYYAYQAGAIRNAASGIGGNLTLTRAELIDTVEDIPGVVDVAHSAKKLYGAIRLPVGAIGLAMIVLSRIDEADAELFFARVRDGIQTGPKDPFTVLSRRIASDLTYGAGQRISLGAALFYLFRTWNAFRSGEQISKFQIGSAAGGWTALPEPK